MTNILFIKQKKILRTAFFLVALSFESVFLAVFFIDANLIGDQKSAFVVEWAFWIQIYLLLSIGVLLITGFLLARAILKADQEEVKIKGIFLLLAFISFTSATVIDVIGADSPTEITILLARTLLIISSIFFYLGFILPKFARNLFIKQRD